MANEETIRQIVFHEIERRGCPHSKEMDALFERMRRLELIAAFMFGTMVMGGGSIAMKIFGVIG